MAHAAAAFAKGWVCVHGYCGGLDLSAFAATNQLFLSSAVPGALTATVPTHGAGYVVRMGMVINGANPGTMFVNHAGEPLLQDISDVSASGKAFFDVPMWMDQTNDVWFAQPASWFPTVNKATSYTVGSKDVFITVDAAGGARTMTLPTVASSLGRKLHFKKIDTSRNQVIIDGNGAETVDGAQDFRLRLQWESVALQCDATEWRVL